ncbi:hypothetical protein [Prolixibacter denitrificans]|uniref:Uncharacterized protein n=1 Tax=Prolixibacter denitrificans TaxID=1541063 RepID=A0A2P8CHF1_9BACT|nr:hypothetical protein [Prolixibacter denitrificans]PSK84405.1 hypothetical protein CLV93_102191 [Prolixibacter denitrificans]GET20579.1 hypothetical protein JCM18694_08250 [Prolixibacter denitrificans]
MKKLHFFLFATLIMGAVILNSCSKNDSPSVADAPSVSAPSVNTDVQVATDVDVTFNVSVPGGYNSATANATGGSATIKSELTAGATSGDVVVTFTADSEVGAGSVSLTVTDANSKSDNATATMNKTAEPAMPTKDVYASADGIGTVTWSADTIYVLRGFIFVNDGQTLTIEPGTIIKGQPGQGAGASALIVARGAKIMAEGTADKPIIMTGLADDLNGSVPDDANQTWGGLIILGKATTSNVAEGGEKSIEGIPETETRGLYGGTDDTDNSGVLKYVSVRHGGSVIGADNEINGISLGAVGSGTTLDHIEVFSNFDDGIEFFGGAPNLRHAVLSYTGDDGLDEDEGFHGTVQYALVWKKASVNESSDPRGSEDDGGVGANEAARPFATVANVNVTLYNEGTNDNLTPSNKQTIYMRDGWAGRWINSVFYGFDGPIDMERRTDKINATDNKSASCYDMWLPVADGGYGTLKIENNLIYTNNAFSNDSTGFANMFQLSDETDAALEYNVEKYLMAKNKIGDPAFGTGAQKFTPTSADITTDVATGLASAYNVSLEDAGFKGAVDPNATTPFFANWTKTWEVINN